jgi:hypothetical protein
VPGYSEGMAVRVGTMNTSIGGKNGTTPLA